MSNTITGMVLGVRDTEFVAGKDPQNPFKKRKVMLDCTRRDQYTGERSEYENTPVIEFTGDKVAELDKCKAGDIVEVKFTVEGHNYTGKDGQPRNYTGIRGFELAVIRSEQPKPAPAKPVQKKDDLPF